MIKKNFFWRENLERFAQIFAKKSNKVSFKVFRQKLLEQHLVQEKLFPLCQIEFVL